MTKVAILPIPTGQGGVTFWAVSNGKRSHGATAGQALDALTAQFSEEETGTLVVVQNRRPDAFFGAAQQQRLAELMARWRSLRDVGEQLPPAEQDELDALVNQELQAAGLRTASLVDELKK